MDSLLSTIYNSEIENGKMRIADVLCRNTMHYIIFRRDGDKLKMQKLENWGNWKTSNNDRRSDAVSVLVFFGTVIIQPLFYPWRRVFQISNKQMMYPTNSTNIFAKRGQTIQIT